MNVYDWDDTIYRGDSTFGFVKYLYVKKPKTLLSIPRTAVCGLLFVLKIMPKLTFKQNLYHMFVFVDDMEKTVEEYTSSHLGHVKQWYKDHQQEDDRHDGLCLDNNRHKSGCLIQFMTGRLDQRLCAQADVFPDRVLVVHVVVVENEKFCLIPKRFRRHALIFRIDIQLDRIHGADLKRLRCFRTSSLQRSGCLPRHIRIRRSPLS